jgi:hypothetical protein
MEPRDLAMQAEAAALPSGTDERFNGWGIMGLPFRSGHVLGLRRFPASSVGPGYTSLWHRTPQGAWTFFGDTPPMQSCTRYFGSAVETFIQTPIAIEWPARRSMRITIPAAGLEWTSRLSPTPVTRAMNALGSMMPDPMWRNTFVLDMMAAVAGVALRAGKLRMRGRAPNGQSFIANPLRIWTIPDADASLRSEKFGPVGSLAEQAWLGDFAIPQRGMFAIGRAFFEPFDEVRHAATTSRA